MLINFIKNLIIFILLPYLIFGFFCTLVILITDIILMRRVPKIKIIIFNYLMWPLTLIYWMKYLFLFIDFAKKYSAKTNLPFKESFKSILKDARKIEHGLFN